MLSQIQVVQQTKDAYNKYNAAVTKWFEMNPWTPVKQKLWVEVICPKLKTKELWYKMALYALDEKEEK